MRISISYFTLIFILLVSVYTDIKSYKIPNKLIMLGITLGLVTNLINYGIRGLVLWFLGIITPILILFVLFVPRMLGAGDIKLFTVVGSFFGVKFIIKSIIVAFILGAIISLVKLVYNKNLLYRLQYLANYIQRTMKHKKLNNYYNPIEGYENAIHFSIAIFIGVVITIFT